MIRPSHVLALAGMLLLGALPLAAQGSSVNVNLQGNLSIIRSLNVQVPGTPTEFGKLFAPTDPATPLGIQVFADGSHTETGTGLAGSGALITPGTFYQFTLQSQAGTQVRFSLIDPAHPTGTFGTGMTYDMSGTTILCISAGILTPQYLPVTCIPTTDDTTFQVGYRYQVTDQAVPSSTPYTISFDFQAAYD